MARINRAIELLEQPDPGDRRPRAAALPRRPAGRGPGVRRLLPLPVLQARRRPRGRPARQREPGPGRADLGPVGRVGGITEAHQIAQTAATYDRPFAPHDCTGPVVFTVGVHLCMAEPNALIQEGVRANYAGGGWYSDVLTDLPSVQGGFVAPPAGPGLGTRLLPDFAQREDVMVRVSS